jgi:hypothetical protein
VNSCFKPGGRRDVGCPRKIQKGSVHLHGIQTGNCSYAYFMMILLIFTYLYFIEKFMTVKIDKIFWLAEMQVRKITKRQIIEFFPQRHRP